MNIHGSTIYSLVIDEAIEQLPEIHGPLPVWEDEDARELYDALTVFRAECIRLWHPAAWEDGLSFVADDYWATYAQDSAEDAYGEAAASDYWMRDKWAEDLQERFTEIWLDGEKYWGDGQH